MKTVKRKSLKAGGQSPISDEHLNRILGAAKLPEMPEEYWQQLPSRIRKRLNKGHSALERQDGLTS